MAWRQLPDGSFFDPNTGDLKGLDGTKEEAARQHSMRAAHRAPLPAVHPKNKFPPLPQQKMVVLPGIKGPQAIIDPVRRLALNPYELGMGAFSDTTKKVLITGGIVAVAGLAIWGVKKIPFLTGGKKSKKK